MAAGLTLSACTAHDEVESDQVGAARLPQTSDPRCVSGAAGERWKNMFVPQQTGKFAARMGLVAHEAPIDAVAGLSNGPASAFTDLAAIVRLNPSGFVDARNGGSYMAENVYQYRADSPLEIHALVDIPNRIYDLWLAFDDDSRIQIARGYRFRTEQSAAVRLDNWAAIVASPSGSFDACFFGASRVGTDACLLGLAGGSWGSEAFPRQAGSFRVTFRAYPSEPRMDAVIGVSNGPPSRFSNLAAIFRFNDQGRLDVRDASGYRADVPIDYTAEAAFDVVMDIDIVSHTYSVRVSTQGITGEYVALATNYRFRTEQASVGALDHIGYFVESPSGNVRICDFTVHYP
ncbi:MAG TPA: hypothetical protein VFZ53_25350 [Polyangiaceae bacterium]